VPFFEWMRSNSEHYLLEAAQRDMARKYLDRSGPVRKRGGMAFLWRNVFTPIYRLLPWSLRRAIIQAMPGSHRRTWTGRAPPGRSA
jgi:hypothetical protein